MPISVANRIKIIKGVIRPKDITINQIVEGLLVEHSIRFIDSVKDFPTSGGTEEEPTSVNTGASSYKNKVLSTCHSILKNTTPKIVSQALLVIASIASASVEDMSAVEIASDDEWCDFLDRFVMLAIEKLSTVENDEKAEYDAISA